MGAAKTQFLKVLSTLPLLVACTTKHPHQASLNRKDNGGNYEFAQIELCCLYCDCLIGNYYNGLTVFRSLFVDDRTAEPTADEKEVVTTYVRYLLNSAVGQEKSTEIWDSFELQEWRCAEFGRFFSAVAVSGNGMLPSADRIDNGKDHDVRGNIRFVFVAVNKARKALTVDHDKAQLAQICAARPPVPPHPPLGDVRVVSVCQKCGMGDGPCTYCPSTCDPCYECASKQNRSRVKTRLV
jgi:hypothetical protein